MTWRSLARDDDRDSVPAKGSRRPNLNGFADQFGMTNFRSEETRRHDGMAEVEGFKMVHGNHESPFGPTIK